ncbi:MAG: hypothetical protein C4308_10585 [Chitinophagaceae bacterium]
MKGVPVQLCDTSRDAYISFFPENDSFTGNGSCNQLSGNYSLKKSEMRFFDVMRTQMACNDIAFEEALVVNLEKVNRCEEKDNRILLKNDREVLLVLERRLIRQA